MTDNIFQVKETELVDASKKTPDKPLDDETKVK